MTMYKAVIRDDVGEVTVRGFNTIAEAVEYAENSGAIQFTIAFYEGRKAYEQSRTQSADAAEPRVQ